MTLICTDRAAVDALFEAAALFVPLVAGALLKRGRFDDPLVLTLAVFSAALALSSNRSITGQVLAVDAGRAVV